MSYHEDEELPPKASEIALHPENAEMLDRLRTNIRRILMSDFADTVEVDTPESSWYSHLNKTYLARVAFMKLSPSDIESTDTSDTGFQLAVVANAYGLDGDTAASGGNEIGSKEFVWPEGVTLNLLDNQHKDRSLWHSQFVRGINKFDISGNKTGFERTDKPAEGFLQRTYGIDDSWGVGAGVDPNGLDSLEEFIVIDGILTNGRLDMAAHDSLRKVAETSSDINVVTHDFKIVRGSQPFFTRLIDTAIGIPEWRDTIAWQQYWHDRGHAA